MEPPPSPKSLTSPFSPPGTQLSKRLITPELSVAEPSWPFLMVPGFTPPGAHFSKTPISPERSVAESCWPGFMVLSQLLRNPVNLDLDH